MKQKSNFSFLLSYAKNEKYKLYLSAFLSICSSILMVVPYILIYNIILELLKTDLNYNRIKKLAIYTAILIVVRLVLFILSGVFSHVAAFSILYNILNKRANTVITTNLTAQEIQKRYGRPFMSRLMKGVDNDHLMVFNDLKNKRKDYF